MKGSHRLYDCITEIGDNYLKEAETFCPEEHKGTGIPWRRWAGSAAAAVLVVGVGRGLMSGGMEASAPSASAPAASIPSEEFAPQYSMTDVGNPTFDYMSSDQELLFDEKEIHFTNGEIWAILAPEETEKLQIPENLADVAAGEADMWLREEDGAYIPSEQPTGIALYTYTEDVYIVSNGDYYYAAVRQHAP